MSTQAFSIKWGERGPNLKDVFTYLSLVGVVNSTQYISMSPLLKSSGEANRLSR